MATKEKFEEAKRLYETANADQRYVLESLFPELKESEDERIRKELLQIAKESEDSFYMVMTPNKRERLITWLEKQAQKPAAWSGEDENRINRLIAYFEDKESFTAEDDVVYANWLKSLKERYTWKPSERQKEALLWCVVHLGGADKQVLGELLEELNKL